MFITALPTLGTGVLVFFVVVWLFAGVSKLALFASVLVLNPVVKWGVYGVSRNEISLSAGPEIVVRLFVGNLILAVLLTVVGYVVAYRLTAAYRRRNGGISTIERILE